MNDYKKDFITDLFIELAKIDFRKNFLNWFLHTRFDNVEMDNREERRQEILDGI